MSEAVYEPWLTREGFPLVQSYCWSLSVKQAKALAARWAELVPHRIACLAQYIRATPGFESWQPDFTTRSMKPLGPWALTVCKTRPGTQADACPPSLSDKLSPAIQADLRDMNSGPPEWVYVDEEHAFSVFFDIGAYMGEAIRLRVPGLHWGCDLEYRRDYSYKTFALLDKAGSNCWEPMIQPRNIVGQILDAERPVNDGFAALLKHICGR
ncbi:MAG: hypothetical protein ACKVS8_03585 [Phycisphaerales bacterium]